MNKGDTVVFNRQFTNIHVEGKIVKVYDDEFIKIRYMLWGIIPIYIIDRLSNMRAHKPKEKKEDYRTWTL